jgi:hypothetical protein
VTARTRLALAALASVALLAVVALASRGPLGGLGGGGGAPSSRLLDYGFTVFVVAYLLAIPFVVWAYLLQRRDGRAGAPRRAGRALVANLLVLVLVVGVAALIASVRKDSRVQPKVQAPPSLEGELGKRKDAAQPREPRFEWPVVFVVAGLGVAGAVAYVVVRRRRRRPLREGRSLASELSGALDDAIDDVRAETDPRRAVIKAYARMEQILATHGLPRRASEAPYEYLARTLQAVDASGHSVERLTGLYERARFSLHEIDPAMRGDAIDALTSVRDELREAA